MFLDDETRRVNEEEKERERLFLSEKFLEVHFEHKPDESEKVEDLQFQLDNAVTMAHQAQRTVECPWSQLDTVRAIVDSYRWSLSNITERMTTDVTDGLDGILLEFLQEARQLSEKQRNTI